MPSSCVKLRSCPSHLGRSGAPSRGHQPAAVPSIQAMERNRRRHGELAVPAMVMIKRLDKNMKNQFTVIRRRGDREYEEGMVAWFDTRQI
ncbi:hypothetical protein Bca52824_011356 [Brassica carinata]|uniref:Uncharacterized protein n=1 Tax=Brassica carinata TaxID=52824 RepID=A0A8X8BBR2_BRACI|nr:hypothetical protein Bca52824_011356 [Brassica carinata]